VVVISEPVRHLGITNVSETVCSSNQIGGFQTSSAFEEELWWSQSRHRKAFEPYRGRGERNGGIQVKIVVEADKVYTSMVGAGSRTDPFLPSAVH